MKRLLSCFLSLCVSCGLLSVFSVTANAEAVAVTGYEIEQDVYIINPASNTIRYEYWSEFTPNNGTQENEQYNMFNIAFGVVKENNYMYRNVWNIKFTDTFPFEVGNINRVDLKNFYFSYLIDDSNTYKYVRELGDYEDLYIYIEYTDGTNEIIHPTATSDKDYSMNINFEFTPPTNVASFCVFIDSFIVPHISSSLEDEARITVTSYFGETKGDNSHDFLIEVATEEEKLLGGILGWVQNIFNKIGDMFTAIKELPTTLWNAISDGLKSLFIPTAEDMQEFSTKMDEMLETKLGALYEVSHGMYEMFDRIKESDETNTISMPTATIPLPGGNSFSFGGYDIQIVPTGFEFIVTSIKTIVGIVCTAMFINGLKKRYDEVMNR